MSALIRSVGLRRGETFARPQVPEPGWGDCLDQGITSLVSAAGSTSSQQGYRFTVGDDDIRACAFLHRNPESGASPVTLRLWAADGPTVLVSKNHTPASNADVWVTIPFDSPVVLESGKTYAVTVRSSTGANINRRYSFTSNVTFHSAFSAASARTINGDGYPTTVATFFSLVDILFALPT